MCNAFTPEKMQVGSIAHLSPGGECHYLYTEMYAYGKTPATEEPAYFVEGNQIMTCQFGGV